MHIFKKLFVCFSIFGTFKSIWQINFFYLKLLSTSLRKNIKREEAVFIKFFWISLSLIFKGMPLLRKINWISSSKRIGRRERRWWRQCWHDYFYMLRFLAKPYFNKKLHLDLVLLKLNLISKLNFSLQQFPLSLLPSSFVAFERYAEDKTCLIWVLGGTSLKWNLKSRFNWFKIANEWFPRNLWYFANQICLSILFPSEYKIMVSLILISNLE